MRKLAPVALASAVATATLLATSGVATATISVPLTTVASSVPAASTPNVLDGQVNAIVQVGNTMVVGGTFTSVAPAKSTSGLPRSYVFAFDATTGAISSTFDPVLDGEVDSLAAGPDGTSVYVGGTFTHVNGDNARDLVRLDLASGTPTAGFKPPAFNGAVNELQVSGGRLFIGGEFSVAGPEAHSGIATVNAATGALDDYMNVQLTAHHNYNGKAGYAIAGVGAKAFDISPDGTQLVAVGNFKMADGVTHDQIVRLNLGATSASVDNTWNTTVFSSQCNPQHYDSWIRNVRYSPDGSYFVVVATGGPHLGQYCDSSMRFESSVTGSAVVPTWTDFTGGDSLYAVAITSTAVYVGGHERWLNNPSGSDSAKAGAVARPGLAALDPASGIPMSWNPGRNPRGIGTQVIYATPTGIWVGSDTNFIGNHKYKRMKLAFFPVNGGYQPASTTTSTLPNDVYRLGTGSRSHFGGLSFSDSAQLVNFTGSTVTSSSTTAAGGGAWGSARGAVQIGNQLFYGWSDGTFHKRTFDGFTFGPDTVVDPYNDPTWSGIKTGSGGTTPYYVGVRPTFYNEIASITSMFYANGKLYYTLSNNTSMFWRWFSPDSGVVGSVEYVAGTASNWARVSGAFLAGNVLYYASVDDGSLHAEAFTNGTPVTSTDTVVGGPSKDGIDWRARGLVVSPMAPHGANQPPTAVANVTCNHAVCSVDATQSTDPEGAALTYQWSFGDGATSTSAVDSHSYEAAGTYPITLQVTDNKGVTGTTSKTVTVDAAAPVTFAGASHVSGAATKLNVTVPDVAPGSALLLFTAKNSDNVTLADPTGVTGFTLLGTSTSGPVTSQVWGKIADATDAGKTVTVAQSGHANVEVQLAAYSGVSLTSTPAAIASNTDSSTASHTTPAIDVSQAGSIVVSYWLDKSSTTTAWSTPSSAVARDTVIGTGSGYLSSVIADSDQAVPASTYAGVTATVAAPSAKGVEWSVVLNPAP